jgi:DNA-binding XRE family transcriptional regulator
VKKKRSRPKLSGTLIELRHRLGHTQESLAHDLGVSWQTVALWETKRAPSGIMLVRLWKMAQEHGHADLVKMFDEAMREWAKGIRLQKVLEESKRADDIDAGLRELDELGKKLVAEDHRLGRRIVEVTAQVSALADKSRKWSWRNQR